MNIKIKHITTQYGELILGSYQDALCLCDWRYRKMRPAIDERIQKGLKADYVEEESQINNETEKQLQEYFSKQRKQFDIPLQLVGTEFQKTIWNILLEIPYGEIDSYLGISKKINNEKAIRAVAAANGANAISIIVPCHRIIGSDGELIGYAGGLNAKKKLLQLENNGRYPEQLGLFDA